MLSKWMLVVCLLVLVATTASCQVNQEMIDKVAAGELQEARASWWGFNAEDATECLQAAIDSGVPKLIVDNVGKPWIVRPIVLRSNQEIVFEEGVEVIAKRGEFKGTNDCLFSAANAENITLRGYGATFRMWKQDYDNPDLYQKAEWRHCISIKSCSNIKIYGLTLTESGGDGIYLGTATQWVTNRDIHIKDVVCDNNYRQGISVITAENLLIENTIMRNTSGTPPQAGIDFEPNNPQERLVNVVMRNCLSENNNSYGYVLAISPLKGDSEPVSMRFENCRAVNNRGPGFAVHTGATVETAVGGLVEFVNCSVEGGDGAGIVVSKPAEQGLVRFVDCSLINTGQKDAAPIVIRSGRDTDDPAGGIEFINLRVVDTRLDQPMTYYDYGGIPVTNISGNLILVDAAGNETKVELTPEVLARWLPASNLRDIPRVGLEGLTLRPLEMEGAPEQAPRWPWQRREGHYLVYAEAGEEVSFRAEFAQVGRYGGTEMPVTVTAPSGEVVHEAAVPFQDEATVSFTAPESGVYAVTADGGANKMRLSDWSHPMALTGAGEAIRFMQYSGELQFYVPAGVTVFGVRIWGEGSGEAVKAALLNPAGEVVEEVDNQFQTYQFEVELPEPSSGEVWTLRVGKPSRMTWEDFYVDLRGVPPLLTPAGAGMVIGEPAQ